MTSKRFLTSLGFLAICSLSLTACGGGGGGGVAPAGTVTREANLTLAQEVPAPVPPAGTAPSGSGKITLDLATSKLSGTIITANVTGATAAHIHDGDIGAAPANNIVIPLEQSPAGSGTWIVPATARALTSTEINRFRNGGYYVNVHTNLNPSGEIRGQLISFADNVQGIFNTFCIGCHFTGGQATFMPLTAGLSYVNLINIPATQSTGIRVIPGDGANSVLYRRVSGSTFGSQMPLNLPPLSPNNQNLIKLWIDTGARNN